MYNSKWNGCINKLNIYSFSHNLNAWACPSFNLSIGYVIATGGLGRVIFNETEKIDIYDPDLAYRGMKVIYDLAQNK